MIIAGTGHRPQKIFIGHDNAFSLPVYERLIDLARAFLKAHTPSHVISGMALGWDLALAEAALELGIPLHAYVPHDDHDKRWTPQWRTRYHGVLTRAAEVKIICPGPYAPWKMQKRNEAMVDALAEGDILLAMWDGTEGGTYNCIKYAKHKIEKEQVGFVVRNLWTRWVRHTEVSSPQSKRPTQ